jgi:hypothetical protein
MPQKLTDEILIAAIDGFELQKKRIDQHIAELRTMLSGNAYNLAAAPEASSRKRTKFSAAARKRMREAQQRRWAKVRGESEAAASKPEKPKRRLSPKGRKAIQEALQRRWAQKRAEAARAKAPADKAPARKAAKTRTAKAPKTRPAKKAQAASVPAATVSAAQ